MRGYGLDSDSEIISVSVWKTETVENLPFSQRKLPDLTKEEYLSQERWYCQLFTLFLLILFLFIPVGQLICCVLIVISDRRMANGYAAPIAYCSLIPLSIFFLYHFAFIFLGEKNVGMCSRYFWYVIFVLFSFPSFIFSLLFLINPKVHRPILFESVLFVDITTIFTIVILYLHEYNYIPLIFYKKLYLRQNITLLTGLFRKDFAKERRFQVGELIVRQYRERIFADIEDIREHFLSDCVFSEDRPLNLHELIDNFPERCAFDLVMQYLGPYVVLISPRTTMNYLDLVPEPTWYDLWCFHLPFRNKFATRQLREHFEANSISLPKKLEFLSFGRYVVDGRILNSDT